VDGYVLYQNGPSVSSNSPPSRRNSSRKIRTVTGKYEKLAKWGSKMDYILPSHGNCAKNDRGFLFLILLCRKTSLGFSKCILVCPESPSEIAWSKMLRKRFFFRQGGIPDPPEVVTGFFGGGTGLWR
jgi:hypothetical protein